MSWEPIDDLPKETTPMDAASLCDIEGHEFSFGTCVDCEEVDEDYDPTPHGAELVTDWADSPSYKGLVAA